MRKKAESQVDKFKQAATDYDEKLFDEKLAKIARQKPQGSKKEGGDDQ